MQSSPRKWLAVGLLALAAACLLVGIGMQGAAADEPPGAVGEGAAGSIVVVAGQITKDTYGLYLVDREHGTICMYEWLPRTRKLRLAAARTYLFDRLLEDYNSDEPSPRDVKKLVAQQKRLGDAPGAP